MTRKQAIAILSVILLLGAGGALVYAWAVQKQAPADEQKAYVNATYGIAFDYTGDYELTEREVGDAQRYHYYITLAEKVAVTPEDGEGPTTITIDIFQNNLDKQGVEDWIRNNSQSNFKLSNGILTPLTIDGREALTYAWDGLYRGESIVFTHRENIIMLSVTYLEPTDKIRADFDTFVRSLKLYEADDAIPVPREANATGNQEPVACTMDAKLCPDGSYVGRVPPSCAFAACPTSETSATLETRIDQGATGLGVKVVPLAVVEDSRCPTDVTCVQAGTVRVRAQAGTETSSNIVIFTLNAPETVAGKIVTLTAVSPNTHSRNPISLQDYRFTFTVVQP